MRNQLRKVTKYLQLVKEQRWKDITPLAPITICPCDYKEGHIPPPLSEFVPFENGGTWGSGWDSHAWFHMTTERTEPNLYLYAMAEFSDKYSSTTPQLLTYVNGVMRQGMDANHRELLLTEEGSKDIYIYAYTGPKQSTAILQADLRVLDTDVNDLYYDLLYPFQMLDYLQQDSAEYAHILYFLYRAVSMLELYDFSSEEFHHSVKTARSYLQTELYEQYCRPQTAKCICIGHTHIDCAWKWTFRQTREKVQRSFATVLELMRRYPEYKFMSSQALLYQNLKEEAPAL